MGLQSFLSLSRNTLKIGYFKHKGQSKNWLKIWGFKHKGQSGLHLKYGAQRSLGIHLKYAAASLNAKVGMPIIHGIVSSTMVTVGTRLIWAVIFILLAWKRNLIYKILSFIL